jgi:hypothetical protein
MRGFGMMLAIIPFVLGLLLWFFEEIDLLNPGGSFGGPGWESPVIFLFGVLTCLGSIPFLYTSGYSDFKNDRKIWALKLILIYPLFLFGIFFQHGSDFSPFLLLTIPLSLLAIFSMHLNLLILSFIRTFQKKHKIYYFLNLACLTAYYVALIMLQFSTNLLHIMKYELRATIEAI